LAADYFDQLHTVMELSLSLPSDTLLVVKEHPIEVGLRSEEFYERIAALPNVVLMNIEEHSYPIIKRSDLVCAVTSSVAHEAAVMGKRVVYLSPHGPLPALPHVHYLASFRNRAAIAELLAADASEGEKQRLSDGARYYLTLRKHCLDLGGIRQFDRDLRPDTETIEQVAIHLLQSVPGLNVSGEAGTKPKIGLEAATPHSRFEDADPVR
jgi:hypothetical protein